MEGSIMRSPRWLVWASCSAAMIFAAPAVWAGGGGTIEGGTITFVGAVVEPTCSVVAMPDGVNLVADAARQHRSLQRNCAAPGTAGVAVDVSRSFDVDVVHLSSSEPDHVLNYFA